MSFQPGQSGNPEGAKPNKPFASALKRNLARRAVEGNADDLDKAADVLIAKAIDGDLQALKELADRLDGRPAQAITGDPDAPHSMVIGWAIPQSK